MINCESICWCCCISYYGLNCIFFGKALMKEYYKEKMKMNQKRYNMVLSTIEEENEIIE